MRPTVFGALRDLVAASEVDGTQEALRSGREEGIGGFKRSYGVPLPLVRSMRALRGQLRKRVESATGAVTVGGWG